MSALLIIIEFFSDRRKFKHKKFIKLVQGDSSPMCHASHGCTVSIPGWSRNDSLILKMTKERNSVRYKAISLVYKFIVKITEKKLLVNVMLYFNY